MENDRVAPRNVYTRHIHPAVFLAARHEITSRVLCVKTRNVERRSTGKRRVSRALSSGKLTRSFTNGEYFPTSSRAISSYDSDCENINRLGWVNGGLYGDR